MEDESLKKSLQGILFSWDNHCNYNALNVPDEFYDYIEMVRTRHFKGQSFIVKSNNGSIVHFATFDIEDMLDFATDQINRGLDPTKETLQNWINNR